MDDSFQKAIREADVKASQRTERRESLVGSTQARADALAEKAGDALKAALSGYAGMEQPVVNIVAGSGIGERHVTVEVSGEELQISGRVSVGWRPGDGVNIGSGRSTNIAINVRRGPKRRESFTIPVDPAGPVLSGNFAVDREMTKREILAAIHRMSN
jgi:hypothetical protein